MKSAWKITVLVNNYVRGSDLWAEHGLSLALEHLSDGSIILLDTGRSGDILLHNAERLGIDWSRLSTIVLSHGHYDHTGGLMSLVGKLGHRVAILHHPAAFVPKAGMKPVFHPIGAEMNMSDFPPQTVSLLSARNDAALTSDLWVTGEIPRRVDTDREASAGFYLSRDGELVEDPVTDDKSIVITKPGEGFYLVCGCCHSGLVNTLRYVKEKSPEKKLLGVLGGLHLIGASDKRMEATIAELKKESPSLLGPIHCSGQKETAEIFKAFGPEIVRFFAAGDSIDL